MTEQTSLCPGCFAEKGDVTICPHCGYDEQQVRSPLALTPGIQLHELEPCIGAPRA